jgi:hypothetical protein
MASGHNPVAERQRKVLLGNVGLLLVALVALALVVLALAG